MHADQASDLDLLAITAVCNGITFFQGPLVDPDIGQLSIPSVFKFKGKGS